MSVLLWVLSGAPTSNGQVTLKGPSVTPAAPKPKAEPAETRPSKRMKIEDVTEKAIEMKDDPRIESEGHRAEAEKKKPMWKVSCQASSARRLLRPSKTRRLHRSKMMHRLVDQPPCGLSISRKGKKKEVEPPKP